MRPRLDPGVTVCPLRIRSRPLLKASGNYMAPTLMNINAYFHPAIVYKEFEDWDGSTPYPEVPLFYEGVTEAGGELLQKMRCALP